MLHTANLVFYLVIFFETIQCDHWLAENGSIVKIGHPLLERAVEMGWDGLKEMTKWSI